MAGPSASAVERFTDSTDLLPDPEALRARLDEDGYLFLRGQVDVRQLAAVRADFLAAMDEAGWLAGDREERRAVAEKFCVEPMADYRRVYHRAWRSEAFHRLPHSLLDTVVTPVLGEEALLHPRQIGRIVFPSDHSPDGGDYTTPLHQDYVSVQGTPRTCTAWVPLHDVSWEQGPLAVVRGSHRDGVRESTLAYGTGGMEITDVREEDLRSQPFEAGDMLVFHSMTVHRGMPNRTDRFRLSMDFRFQPRSEPINELSLELNSGDLNWESLYAGWERRELAYFWRRGPLTTVPFDTSYEDARNEKAIEFARRGDRRAVSALQRMAVHDRSAERRELARRLLAQLEAPKGEGRPARDGRRWYRRP